MKNLDSSRGEINKMQEEVKLALLLFLISGHAPRD